MRKDTLKRIDERLGEIGVNNSGYRMKIVEYNSFRDVTVLFDNGYRAKSSYSAFTRGAIKNIFGKTVLGEGYLGEGEYQVTVNGKATKYYTWWKAMMMRCYDSNFLKRNPSYIGCTVCEEWKNFQNFCKWLDENYYSETDDLCLDKDILCKGQKVYSPMTCIFVPRYINRLFMKTNESRGIYEINNKNDKKTYTAMCRYEGNLRYLGNFNTKEEAFQAYKKFKESVIKETAERYKDRIPLRLYDLMCNYEVTL